MTARLACASQMRWFAYAAATTASAALTAQADVVRSLNFLCFSFKCFCNACICGGLTALIVQSTGIQLLSFWAA